MTGTKGPERTRKFMPKVKTGCFTCRRRRIKCPQQRPICRRCVISSLECTYPAAATKSQSRSALAPAPLVPQPATWSSPDSTPATSEELSLFREFSNHIVHEVSGSFNQRFWREEVPRAAATYPALWHAGVAMAAIHLSMKKQASREQMQIKPGKGERVNDPKYVLALSHFNKSIQHLSSIFTARDYQLSYADKEMAIMTNMLYIGISGTLEDEVQIHTHYKNLLRLLGSIRFGNEDTLEIRRGILSHEVLISLVMAMDGFVSSAPDVAEDGDAAWTITIPQYDQFASVTQAYLAFLRLLGDYIASQDAAQGRISVGASKPVLSAQVSPLRQFERSLAEFRTTSMHSLSLEEEESIELLQLNVDVLKIKEHCAARTRRQDIIREEQALNLILDNIERRLSPSPASSVSSSSSSPSSSTFSLETEQPYLYSLSYGTLLVVVISRTHSVEIRRRGIAMMRRRPFKDGGISSDETIAYFEALIKHDLSGPSRTRALQMAGNAVIPTYPDAGLAPNAQFDGTRECECISGIFVCHDHKMVSMKRDSISETPGYELISRYEQRNNMASTRYYL